MSSFWERQGRGDRPALSRSRLGATSCRDDILPRLSPLDSCSARDTLTRLFPGFSGPQCAQVHSLSDLRLRKSGIDDHAMWEPADGRDNLGEIRDASLGAARTTREKA